MCRAVGLPHPTLLWVEKTAEGMVDQLPQPSSIILYYRKWNYNGMSWHFLFGDYCLSQSNKMAKNSNNHIKSLSSPSDNPWTWNAN